MLGDDSERWLEDAALSESELVDVDAESGFARSDEAGEAGERFWGRVALRLFLFGPRIFRSGAYSHWRPFSMQRLHGFSPVHYRG